jgi:hypothetical protein
MWFSPKSFRYESTDGKRLVAVHATPETSDIKKVVEEIQASMDRRVRGEVLVGAPKCWQPMLDLRTLVS